MNAPMGVSARTTQSSQSRGLGGTPAPGALPQHTPPSEDGLHAALFGLSLLAGEPLRLEEVLTGVAQLGQQAVPGAEGASLRLLEAGRPDLVIGSTDVVRELNAIQYRLDEGPCVTAVTETRTVRCDSLSAEQLWPRLRREARHLDVQSVLSLPLILADQVLGSISVYAHGSSAFTEQALTAAQRFSCAAIVTLRGAQLLANAQRMSIPSQTTDAARHDIDQALGLIVSRSGGTPVQAFERLLVVSQRAHRRVSAIAAQIVGDAARSAHARRARARTRARARQLTQGAER